MENGRKGLLNGIDLPEISDEVQKNILDLTSFALLINESVCVCVDSEWLYNIIVFIKSESRSERE